LIFYCELGTKSIPTRMGQGKQECDKAKYDIRSLWISSGEYVYTYACMSVYVGGKTKPMYTQHLGLFEQKSTGLPIQLRGDP